ncbi:MAG TPA: DegT/DnrJ/EryC1/StrS family aminotransferase [Fervidobacterium sp.]|nr:DegT/DnrJ/EryC1/StrS family aminotransferase [Fervidobacterium sp.]
MINVTRSIMPDAEKYHSYIDKLWGTRWLTNNGEYLVQLEQKLGERFSVNCITVPNGTLALLIGIQLFDFEIGSEIITTPFSFVATTSSILWQRYKPVFVDIDSETFNIDVSKIEEKITDKTKAILAVHVFGNPCDVQAIEHVAKKYSLKVIYDAAHCFDVFYDGKSIYKFGDVCAASFHATKVFHTIEGGALLSDNKELADKAKRLRNFGFDPNADIVDIGINAKMNEFQAAMGLLNLELVDEEIEKRKERYESYKELLRDIPVRFQKINPKLTKYNYIYMPVVFETKEVRERVYRILFENGYNTRRYFYPSLNSVFSKESCPVSEDISSKILHLPLYGDLELQHVGRICSVIKNTLEG